MMQTLPKVNAFFHGQGFIKIPVNNINFVYQKTQSFIIFLFVNIAFLVNSAIYDRKYILEKK
jgi:hypothetical protein